jgi:hypothetical protein
MMLEVPPPGSTPKVSALAPPPLPAHPTPAAVTQPPPPVATNAFKMAPTGMKKVTEKFAPAPPVPGDAPLMLSPAPPPPPTSRAVARQPPAGAQYKLLFTKAVPMTAPVGNTSQGCEAVDRGRRRTKRRPACFIRASLVLNAHLESSLCLQLERGGAAGSF